MAKSSRVCVATVVIVLTFVAVGSGVGIYFGIRQNNSSADTTQGESANSTGTTATTTPAATTVTTTVIVATLARNISEPPLSSTAAPGDNADVTPTGTAVGKNVVPIGTPISRTKRFYGINYSPFGVGDNNICAPFRDVGGRCLLNDQVYADVRQLSGITNRIKTYSLICLDAIYVMLDYAAANDMQINLGVWVVPDEAENAAELARFRQVMDVYKGTGVITDITVGNEAILVEGLSVTALRNMLVAVRDITDSLGVTPKIGTAEIAQVWDGSGTLGNSEFSVPQGIDMSPVVAVSDFIGLNSHPYYIGTDPAREDSSIFVMEDANRISQRYRTQFGLEKPTWILETGYPSGGPVNDNAQGLSTPSLLGAEMYMTQIEEQSRVQSRPVYYFEAYDSDWKKRWQPYREIDYFFGIFMCDRSLKNIDLPPPGAL